jgi:Domain of unknown function (DUF4386)
MNTFYQRTARVAALLLLIQFITGILVNEVLLGPYTFSDNYLREVAAHAKQVNIGMLLGIVSGAAGVLLAALLLPVFKMHTSTLAYAFLAFSIIDFANIAIDNTAVQLLLSLSRQYSAANGADAAYFQYTGTILHAAREWTHLASLLIACFSLFSFYYVLFRGKLLPLFISVWGQLAALLMGIAVLLMIFHRPSSVLLILPLGLNQLFLIVWMLVKGWRVQQPGK